MFCMYTTTNFWPGLSDVVVTQRVCDYDKRRISGSEAIALPGKCQHLMMFSHWL